MLQEPEASTTYAAVETRERGERGETSQLATTTPRTTAEPRSEGDHARFATTKVATPAAARPTRIISARTTDITTHAVDHSAARLGMNSDKAFAKLGSDDTPKHARP